VYLEAALRTLRGCLPRRPPADINLPCEAIYADDTDFISTDHEYLSNVNEIAPAALGEWLLYDDVDKTERTNIKRDIDCVLTIHVVPLVAKTTRQRANAIAFI